MEEAIELFEEGKYACQMQQSILSCASGRLFGVYDVFRWAVLLETLNFVDCIFPLSFNKWESCSRDRIVLMKESSSTCPCFLESTLKYLNCNRVFALEALLTNVFVAVFYT